MTSDHQQQEIQAKKRLRALNKQISERTKYQSEQERQIKAMIEQGNDVLLDLNDVIIQKKYQIKMLEADRVLAERRLDDFYIEHPEVAPSQGALAGI